MFVTDWRADFSIESVSAARCRSWLSSAVRVLTRADEAAWTMSAGRRNRSRETEHDDQPGISQQKV